MKEEHKKLIRSFLQLTAIAIIFLVLNLDGFEHSYLLASMNVLLQSIIACGLLALFGRSIIWRIFVSFLLVFCFFIKTTYGAPLSVSVVMAIITSPHSEYLSFFRLNSLYLFVSVMLLILLVAYDFYIKSTGKLLVVSVVIFYLILPMYALSQSLESSTHFRKYLQTGLARGYSESYTVIEYLVKDLSARFPPVENFRGVIDAINFMYKQSNHHSSWTNVLAGNGSNLLVIGIGESLRAKNLSLYGYSRETTPLLSGMSDKLDIFSHSYAAGTNTWSSLPAALTMSVQGPDLTKSIIHLANDAGFKTYWISNQAKYSHWDFSVSAIADQAEETLFLSEDFPGSQYDQILIEKLEELLRQNKGDGKQLIVLHYYGSHQTFSDRYPEEYSLFKGKNSRLNKYDNSVFYTDYIQSEAIRLVSEYGGKYLFFADHGLGSPQGEIPLKHDVRDNPSLDSLHVPFFLYPREKMDISYEEPVSLYYFECIFSQWSGITAEELKGDYCKKALSSKVISYVDANLLLNRVSF